MQSADITADRLAGLRDLLPEAFTEGKVDFDRLREALGEEVEDRPERYSFTWAGKRDAMRLLQVPSRATLVPCPKESVDWDTTQDLFIEGENLEVLKLLYKSYAGRVKMIYIDPPYNTGNDFIYPDDFRDPLQTYLKLTGQKDTEGNLLTSNPETSGRYHSTWLSMMYPRLFVARQLLSEDGILFVSMSDDEMHNLRLALDEVFGAENFIGTIVWNSTKSVTNTALISVSHTYNFVYARSREYFVKNRHHFRLPETGEGFANPDNDPRGPWKADPFQVGGWRPNQQYVIVNPKTAEEYRPNPGSSWKNEEAVFKRLLADNRIVFGVSGEAGPQRKRFQSEAEERGRVTTTLWDDLDTTTNATRDLKQLFGTEQCPFDNPKPVDLIQRMVQLGTHDPHNSIVLDFFAGACVTAEAVLRQNIEDGGTRTFICVQLPEPTSEDSPARKAGYATIADVGKERVRLVIKSIKDEFRGKLDLKDRQTPEEPGFRVFKLAESNYRPWKGVEKKDGEAYADTMEMFADPLLPGWKPVNVLYEVALKEGYSLTSKIEKVEGIKDNAVWCVTDPDKGQSFRICLDETLKPATVKALALKKDDLFICRDSALTDEQAANLALQCNLKTI